MFSCFPRASLRASPASFRRQATRFYASPAKPRLAGKSKPTVRSIPSPQTSGPVPASVLQASNKRAVAEQILNAGRDVIYKAPSHVGMLLTAWAVSSSGIMCCIYFSSNGYLDSENMKERGLQWWVSPVFKVVAAFMGLCSGVFLAQSFAFVSAIRIIKEGSGAVKLLVTQRPWFPIWKHHRYVIEPSELQINRRVAFFAQKPSASRTDVAQQATVAREVGGIFKNMILSPFLIMRKLFFHEGVLKIAIPTGKKGDETWVRLDLDGNMSNHGKDLLDIATIRS